MSSETHPAKRRTPPHLATLVLMAGISAMAMNIFLPSLNSMAAYFDASYSVIQLSVALFLAANGVSQIIIGPLADRYGRRPVVLGGITIFILATIGCLLATSATVFLMFRMMQAAIAAAMALSRAIVRDMVPEAQAASMIGYVMMGMAVVPMISPAIGGFLEAQFGWHASFLVLLGVGILLFVVCWIDLGETAPNRNRNIWQQFSEYPELLRSKRFWAFTLANAFSSGAYFAYLGGGTFVGEVVFDLHAQTLGIAFGAPAIGYFLGNFLSGRYSARYGIEVMVITGAAVVTIGILISLMIFWSGHGNAYSFFALMTAVGLGNGLTIPSATAAALSVKPSLAGTASGLNGAIMILGGAALSAVAGLALNPERGVYPLLYIMLMSATMSLACAFYGIWRRHHL